MKKRLLLIPIFACLSPLLISGKDFDMHSTLAIGNYSTDSATYYNGITATYGKELAAQLHDLITSTHMYYSSYNDNGSNGYQKNTDQYYENGQKVSGKIYEFYSGVAWPNGWYPNAGDTNGGYNREHCWCQSNSINADGEQMWGVSGGGADMHHLRPVETRLNSTRNNHPYGEVSNRDTKMAYAKYGDDKTYALGGYVDGTADIFEPLDSKKGDVARILFYVYIHYNSYTVSSLFGNYATTNGSGSSSYFSSSLLSLTKTTNQTTEQKAIDMLLKWNKNDPVDASEISRNNQVAIYQGNRNPFIDNSNYANLIWGEATPVVNSVSVSPSSLNLTLGSTNTGSLTATVNVSNNAAKTVSWSSSDTTVATVNNSGLVTAVGVGATTITATSTVDLTKKGECTVTVLASSTPTTVPVNSVETAYTVSQIINYFESSDYVFNADEFYFVKGNFKKINSSYSEQYSDISFTVSDGTNDFMFYRMKLSANKYFNSGEEVIAYGKGENIIYYEKSSIHEFQGCTFVSATADSKEWCDKFLNTVTCDNGITPPSVSSWKEMETAFKALLVEEQARLKTYSHDALERYDYIINKYGSQQYTNFINRSMAHSSRVNVQKTFTQDISALLIVVISVTGLSLIGCYFLLRKHRCN